MARPAGFEPATPSLGNLCSILLSYGRMKPSVSGRLFLAERVGFEPTEGVNPRRFSRPLPSTTRPPLLNIDESNHSILHRKTSRGAKQPSPPDYQYLLPYDGFSSHVRLKGFRDDDTSVRLLVIFQQCRNRAVDG